MEPQTISFEVRGAAALLSHTCTWRPELDAPQCTVEMPKDSVIAVQVASVGKVVIDKDLEFDPTAAMGGPRLVRWTAAAKEAGYGSGSVTFSHASSDFNDVSLSVDMCDEPSLHVEEPTLPVVEPPLTNMDVVNRYGAYVCCAVAALGALIFAALMPAHSKELAAGAGAIALWGWLDTDPYDRFVLRIVGFVAAGITMGFAMAIPDYTKELISAAGVMCMLAIVCGEEKRFAA
jgi:hypothetical protein